MRKIAFLKQGFTLLETLIALIVLTVGIMGFTATFSRIVTQSTIAWNDTQSMVIASSVLEELNARDFSDWSEVGALEQLFSANYSGEALVSENYYTVLIDYTDVLDGDGDVTARNVIITINWGGEDWRADMARAGFGNDEFSLGAYVLEATVIRQVAESPYGDNADS